MTVGAFGRNDCFALPFEAPQIYRMGGKRAFAAAWTKVCSADFSDGTRHNAYCPVAVISKCANICIALSQRHGGFFSQRLMLNFLLFIVTLNLDKLLPQTD